ncbi:WG repeat-containing protein [Actinoplanes sp. M2I2]|uniref:WG repeat-containing protein n=1 Tax=Actinoplanes sp. M2I2 TaxID=1734444 RepID=UPI0020202EFE|nr:WG repeat-containing protein [Actinoplanes sp. M2I2]
MSAGPASAERPQAQPDSAPPAAGDDSGRPGAMHHHQPDASPRRGEAGEQATSYPSAPTAHSGDDAVDPVTAPPYPVPESRTATAGWDNADDLPRSVSGSPAGSVPQSSAGSAMTEPRPDTAEEPEAGRSGSIWDTAKNRDAAAHDPRPASAVPISSAGPPPPPAEEDDEPHGLGWLLSQSGLGAVTPLPPPIPQPITGSPVAHPVVIEPIVEPSSPAPVSSQPVSARPVSAQPVSAWPVSAQPVSAQPAPTQPVTTTPAQTQQAGPGQPISAAPDAQPVSSWPPAAAGSVSTPPDTAPVADRSRSEHVQAQPGFSPAGPRPPVEPAGAHPFTSEPVSAQPSAAQPVSGWPAAIESVDPRPSANEPVPTHPVSAHPISAQPVSAQPVSAHPISAQPVSAQPVSAQPVSAQPISAQPISAQPVSAWPAAIEPVSSQPTSAQPVSAQPVAAQTASSQPTSAETAGPQPTSAQPVDFQPTPADAGSIQPPASEPVVSQPVSADHVAAGTDSASTSAGPPLAAQLTSDQPTAAQTSAAPLIDEVRPTSAVPEKQDWFVPSGALPIIVPRRPGTPPSDLDDPTGDIDRPAASRTPEATGTGAETPYADLPYADYDEPIAVQAIVTQRVAAPAPPAGSHPVQPAFDEPAAAQPAQAQHTSAHRSPPTPFAPEPLAPEPVGPRPVPPEPTSAQPMSAQPISAQPMSAQPVSAQPTSAQPVSAQPMSAQPVSAQPTSAQPVSAQPGPAEFETAQPTPLFGAHSATAANAQDRTASDDNSAHSPRNPNEPLAATSPPADPDFVEISEHHAGHRADEDEPAARFSTEATDVYDEDEPIEVELIEFDRDARKPVVVHAAGAADDDDIVDAELIEDPEHGAAELEAPTAPPALTAKPHATSPEAEPDTLREANAETAARPDDTATVRSDNAETPRADDTETAHERTEPGDREKPASAEPTAPSDPEPHAAETGNHAGAAASVAEPVDDPDGSSEPRTDTDTAEAHTVTPSAETRPESTVADDEDHADAASTGSPAVGSPAYGKDVEPIRQRREQRADPRNRRTDPEQILAAYPVTYDPQTLREQIEDDEPMWVVIDRLTDKLEYAERDADRARLLSLRAVASRLLEDLDPALDDARAALAHAEAAGELVRTATVRARLAHVLQWRGDYAEADRIYAKTNTAELPARLRAEMHELAGRSAFEQGRYLEAVNHLEGALDLRNGADPDLVQRIELALDTITGRAVDGWGPYPRTRAEILGETTPARPVRDEESGLFGYPGLLPARFAQAQPFADGVAWVRRPEAPAWELIDESGALLIDASSGYRAAGRFADGLAWVSRDDAGGWHAIDKQNRVIVPGAFEDARPFHNGLALVRRGGWGAVDQHTRIVVQPHYQAFATMLASGEPVDGFTEEGLAVVDAGEVYGVVDRTGQLLVQPVHAALLIHPAAFLVADRFGLWGALDRQGAPLVELKYRERADVLDEIDKLIEATRPVL